MDDRTLRAHVFAYTQQTCEVAQWLASQVSDSQAWAQTEPLDYIVHDLVSAAEEVQERQIPVPWRINIACLRFVHLYYYSSDHANVCIEEQPQIGLLLQMLTLLVLIQITPPT